MDFLSGKDIFSLLLNYFGKVELNTAVCQGLPRGSNMDLMAWAPYQMDLQNKFSRFQL